jgi:hypothetical protein
MIRCLPTSLCSWDFVLQGDGQEALLEFNWLSEQGKITANGTEYDVCKHGVLSGNWTLESGGQAYLAAQKSSAFVCQFELTDTQSSYSLSARSMWGRSFELERDGDLLATISPDHLFTRRATIETPAADADFELLAFAFWLVALMWRRAAQNN